MQIQRAPGEWLPKTLSFQPTKFELVSAKDDEFEGERRLK